MRNGMRLGTSLLALTIAVPAVPATITVASAQSLIDGLFRAPARRKRALRQKKLRQNRVRQSRREVRRQRRATRKTARKPAAQRATRRVAKKKRATRAPARTERVAAIKKVKAPTFKNYKAEAFVPVDIASAAGVVAAAVASERMLLRATPLIRQVPSDPLETRGTTAELLDRAGELKALMPSPAAAPVSVVARINMAAESDVDDLLAPIGPSEAPTPEMALAEINRAAAVGAGLGSGLDEAPRFEVSVDPRLEELAGVEAAWKVMAAQSERATGPVGIAVAQHYQTTRDFVWTDGETVRPGARRAIEVLRGARSYGLDPSDYIVPIVPGPGASLDRLMAFELALTVAVAEYMRDASIGRVVADGLSGYHDLPRRNPELERRLAAVAEADDPTAAMLEAHPSNRQFDLLRDELVSLIEAESDPLPQLPARTTLRAGGRPNENASTLMALLKRRTSNALQAEHAEAIAAYNGGDTLPAELDGFLRGAQKEYGLLADGIIGPRSIAKLNGESQSRKIEALELALERIRWLPEELGREHVFINQPAYRVQHMIDDAVNLSMRVVVGKTTNQTNFFYDKISHIEFQPDWGVPRSIVVNEYLPRLRRDPGYLDRLGYEVRDARGRRVSSSRVAWGKYGANVPFSVRQPPSANGALGELKIDFPNRHAIYMHDTPAKNLFNRETRAYSHGCVRLHDPRAMAAAMLGTDKDDIARRIRKGHHTTKVERDIPVYIAYFTAWPNDEGKIGYYGDVYGRDKALKTAIEKTRAARAS